jgi:hypothetical protein
MALRVQRLPTARATPSLHKSVATRCRYVRGGSSRWGQALAQDHVARWSVQLGWRGLRRRCSVCACDWSVILRMPRAERWRDDVRWAAAFRVSLPIATGGGREGGTVQAGEHLARSHSHGSYGERCGCSSPHPSRRGWANPDAEPPPQATGWVSTQAGRQRRWECRRDGGRHQSVAFAWAAPSQGSAEALGVGSSAAGERCLLGGAERTEC